MMYPHFVETEGREYIDFVRRQLLTGKIREGWALDERTKDSLISGFSWPKSPQGHNFWSRICLYNDPIEDKHIVALKEVCGIFEARNLEEYL